MQRRSVRPSLPHMVCVIFGVDKLLSASFIKHERAEGARMLIM